MIHILKIILLFLLISYGTHILAQPGIGIHPLDTELSIRTNKHNKSFWDFRVGLAIGTMERDEYYKYELQTIWNRRAIDKKQVRLYYGIGLAIKDFMPQFVVPLGVEVFPFSTRQKLSFSAELVPTIDPFNSSYIALASDVAFRCYF